MLDKARKQARKAIEKLYDAKCTIYEYQKVKDPITKQTKQKEVAVLADQSCKLSYSSSKSTSQSDTGNEVPQVIKIFIAPELDIRTGSKLVVTNKGRTAAYQNSGEPAIYSTHQEVVLNLFAGWA